MLADARIRINNRSTKMRKTLSFVTIFTWLLPVMFAQEPPGQEVPNIAFKISEDLGEDEDGEPVEDTQISMHIAARTANTVIQIDLGYGKEDFTIPTTDPVALTRTVDSGETVKIYGELTEINLDGNQHIVRIDFGENPQLEKLYLRQNKITEIELSKLPALRELAVTANKLKRVDLTHLPELSEFYGGYNEISELNLVQNDKLTLLTCNNNAITELDLSKNTELVVLTAGDNAYTKPLDLSHCLKLKAIDLENIGLETLDILPLKHLNTLRLMRNRLTALDITGLTKLRLIDLRKNQFSACALNDVMCYLPEQKVDEAGDAPKLLVKDNPGAAGTEPYWGEGIAWQIDQVGDGSGCEQVRVALVTVGPGTLSLKDGEKTIQSMAPVTKGKMLSIEATPQEGSKVEKIVFEDQPVEGNTFTPTRYGTLTATFVQHTNVCFVDGADRKVCRLAEGYYLVGLTPGIAYRLYDMGGRLLSAGQVTAEGTLELRVAQPAILHVGDAMLRLL